MPSSDSPLSTSDTHRIRLQRLSARVEDARIGAIAALTRVLQLKEVKSGRFADQLAGWSGRVAEQMGVAEEVRRDVEIASLLFDIGKIGIPDAVLLKPSALSDAEYRQVRKHPEYGWSILRSIPGLERVALLVLHHQERFDGSGYPAGLSGQEIPLGSRIIAVVDTLEAMLSDRPYRPGFTPSRVIDELRPEAGRQFDPEVLELFIRIAGWNPPDLPDAPSTRIRSVSTLATAPKVPLPRVMSLR